MKFSQVVPGTPEGSRTKPRTISRSRISSDVCVSLRTTDRLVDLQLESVESRNRLVSAIETLLEAQKNGELQS